MGKTEIDTTLADSDAQVFVGTPAQPTAKPAFTVHKLEGKVPHQVHIFDEGDKRIKRKVIEEDAGFLVKFAKGHSIRCRNKEHLQRVGAGATLVPVVNNDGEVISQVPNVVQTA